MDDLQECPRCHLAESWRGDASGRCVECDWVEGEAVDVADPIAALRARAEKAEAERDAALADNAALRKALREALREISGLCGPHGEVFHRFARAALSAPTPGDGYVVLTREEAERLVDELAHAGWGEKEWPMPNLLRGKVKP